MAPLMHLILLLAPILLAALWQAALLALATATLLRLLPSLSAAARSRIWTAAFLLAAALPFATLSLAAHSAHTAGDRGSFHATASLAAVFLALWFAGLLFRAVQLVRGAFHLRGVALRAEPVACIESSTAEICTSTEVGVPSIAGFFHPRILIPAALYPTLAPADLHHIVLHESEHLRRRDDWTNLLQKLTLVLFPFSPALLWMEHRLCLERELACDDGVLRVTGASRAYATTLTNLAEHGFLRRTLSLALGAIRHRSEVARRVHRILAQPAAEMSPRRAALASTLLFAGILGAAVAFARAPQLIVFTSRPAATVASVQPMPFPTSATLTQSITPRPTFVKAIMPAIHTVAYQPRRARLHAVRRTRTAGIPLSQPWIVMTTLRDSQAVLTPSSIRRVRFNADVPDQVPVLTYAAVPTRSGWLIIQL